MGVVVLNPFGMSPYLAEKDNKNIILPMFTSMKEFAINNAIKRAIMQYF